DRRHRRKAQVGRIVKQAINAELTGIKAYQRERELRERLEDEDVETDIGSHPIGEIIARICWDLGLDPNWRRWAEDHWAVEEARTKAPGSPYAEDEEDGEAEEDEEEEAEAEEEVEAAEPDTGQPAREISEAETAPDGAGTEEPSAAPWSADTWYRHYKLPHPATGSDPPSG
ncbi:MAG TPA: hypothetical protein VNT30_00190, partial [Stellaceae bacterium]|nr:hypothetical protein [Stellaceae bacterium]